jgi:hypothetical protein
MGKSKQYFTETQIQRRIQQGFGLGQGKDYKPWLRVQDVPSLGRSHKIYSHRTERVHHLLSDLERAVFLILDWKTTTCDIREQFPLILEDTLDIAKESGIKHPQIVGIDQVMTSDFLVDTVEKHLSKFVVQVKPVSMLKDKRVVEKLEIERRYWDKKEIPFYIASEQSFSDAIHKNLAWLYPVQQSDYQDEQLLRLAEFYCGVLANEPKGTLIEICKEIDTAYQQELGQAIYDLRTLMSQRLITFDISVPWQSLTAKDLTLYSLSTIRQVLHVSGE